MLVLTRKESQKILIGTDIWITVCEIGSNQVRIGIDAPREIPICRHELLPLDVSPPVVFDPTQPQEVS